MTTQNTLALLNMYRAINVQAVRTPSGIVFMGVKNLREEEKRNLLSIPQGELEAALRWQQ
ncbi:hypothetical protein [Atlantibacter hermannii]|uniref:hypothetical protein n=1 Tax=Atlantibacter hermannii TaxID=565 RepID=UPI0028B05E0D|nr:hypothetical protein [Atlantibacter hermannii]